ncbi:squalene/phytoene synthase family protein [Verrucomicrobia bacterium]|jgi:farnesyl-diphosphate farnesyltransferase|nr:squalene/phytoene synthase family protein [Verrucomicrobiota bacterium]MDA7866971.1 squalene/phytoene synthase family protein [Verrucomicrobiota bacterium]MDB4746315.1 squalene/phytoene synthase family protein [Verrucomicrobiota bacterium]MDB4798589.1 squalene/phytoene synthase family protein [Verrucomicrobiota bacterium]
MSVNNDSGPSEDQLLTDLLKAVSRSFYLTLRVLPKAVRRPISIAYLLARTSDTIADTDVLDAASRLDSLDQLNQAIARPAPQQCDFAVFLTHQSRGKERELLQRVNESLALLSSVDEEDLRLIRKVLEIIISGQRLDLQRFQDASANQIVSLSRASDLDDYTYRVAGCVGEFWTRICFKHLLPNSPLPTPQLIEQSIRFGKGLQLVNILRDLGEDLNQGRCYLPADELASCHLKPESLSEHQEDLSPLFQKHIALAQDHLHAGWAYTNQLPWAWVRVRLACAWPILLGLMTLEQLPVKSPTDRSKRAKVTRREVKSVILKSIVAYPFPPLWRGLVKKQNS